MLCAGGQLHGQAAAPSALPPGDGKDLVAVACNTQCHGLKPILMLRYGSPGWKNSVQEMVMRGAPLLPQEADTIIQYLAKNFGPGSSLMQSATAPEKGGIAQTGGVRGKQSLPAGVGKELVESSCTTCHDLGMVTSLKRTKEDWNNIVNNMVAWGITATPEQIQTMASYLAVQFGEKAE